jgi:hypothetical protein
MGTRILCLCRRVRGLGHGGLHLLPTRRSQRLSQAMFRRLPMWLSGRDLTLSCFRQTKDTFTSVLSRPDVDPTLPAQQCQSAGESCAVHGKAGTQGLLVRLADNVECGQKAKLGDFDVGLAEFLVVDPGDQSCEATKVLTCASQRKKSVGRMNVANWPVHDSMYIHLFGFVSSNPNAVVQITCNWGKGIAHRVAANTEGLCRVATWRVFPAL